ncbi:NF-kappa-B inhibitor alpha [Aplysia californica]|uniref:NF-kappa-B inhibitor alpha n=1 Tax=Aplysia californica TaxID=6500 RepID=A0ABM0K8T1_APLCA|nr:NF-kappa-B inhibitor alpha [Aplysia californica]
MEDDIQADCEGYGHGNSRRLHAANMSTKKFNSIEDQEDSALGSLGYVSGDLNSLSIVDFPVVEEEKEQEQQKNNPSFDIVDSFRGLDIVGRAQSQSSQTDSNRCDSGLVEDRPSIDSVERCESNIRKEHWVSPNFSSEQVMDIFRGDEDGDNHLHLSIIHGLPEVTMQVIGLAPDGEWLSQTNNMLQTPLHIAVITRQVAVVRRLMCAGAFVDVQDQMGNTPLHNACRLGFEDVVRTLLTPVRYEETYQNSYDIPLQCIPQDLESKNYEGLTCLHLAAIGGHINVMRLLLFAGANVNAAEGKGGRTVLHLAADWGHIEMMKFLLSRRDIFIDAKTYAGLTPILLAYGRKHEDAVAELFSRGASCTTLLLTEESDGDTSDEEMVDESLYNHRHNAGRGRGFQLTNR